MTDLTGKTILITGAAHGIGRALSEKSADLGMKIVLVDIAAEPLAAFAGNLGEKTEVLPIHADVGDSDQWTKIKDGALTRFGELNVLVNNAGVFGAPGRSWEIAEDEWQRVIRINLDSVIHSVRVFVPELMNNAGPAHIVNVASIAGHVTQPFSAPYHASKFAITALTECLFHEFELLGADIGLTLVSPGFTQTNILAEGVFDDDNTGDPVLAKLQQSFQDGVKDGTSPDDVATAILTAIIERKFYCFPNPTTVTLLEERFGRVLDGQNPDLGEHMRRRFK